ncbi:hypothetical protein GF324_02325, partial [bacterium]|nr:hypothetical protein [bacterium]
MRDFELEVTGSTKAGPNRFAIRAGGQGPAPGLPEGDAISRDSSFAYLLIFFFLVLSASPVQAQISPGKLSYAHEELEGITNCTQCHELGQRELSAEKCLACHTALKQRIDRNEGYHVSEAVRAENCSRCHVEHAGRDAELVHWPEGKTSFDHRMTGYTLEGRHTEPDCEECHKAVFQQAWLAGHEAVDPQSTFLGLDRSCITCHVDEHREQLTDRCLDCHSYDGWRPARGFDHN